MGSRVATLKLAFRFLSLGGEMLSHMPIESLAKPCVPLTNIDDHLRKDTKDNSTSDEGMVVHSNEHHIASSPTHQLQCDASTQISTKKVNRIINKDTIDPYLKLCISEDDVPALLYCKQNEDNNEESILDISNINSRIMKQHTNSSTNIESNEVNSSNVLPIFSALIKEIMKLQTGNISKENLKIAEVLDLNNKSLHNKTYSDKMLNISKHKSKPVTIKNKKTVKKTIQIKKKIIHETQSDFIRRLSKPKNQPIRTHNKCDISTHNKKKQIFICGTTKSVLLRFQKNKEIQEKIRKTEELNINLQRNEYKNAITTRIIPLSSMEIHRIPIPTPRHSIVNDMSSLNISETTVTNEQNSTSKNAHPIASLFERDAIHFNSPHHALSPILGTNIEVIDNYIDDDLVLKIIREVIQEREKYNETATITNKFLKYNESNISLITISNTSSTRVQSTLQGHIELADLEMYQQTFSDSSEAMTVSDEVRLYKLISHYNCIKL